MMSTGTARQACEMVVEVKEKRVVVGERAWSLIDQKKKIMFFCVRENVREL